MDFLNLTKKIAYNLSFKKKNEKYITNYQVDQTKAFSNRRKFIILHYFNVLYTHYQYNQPAV